MAVPWLAKAARMYREGFTVMDIARRIGVSRQSLEQQRHQYPELFGERQWSKIRPAAHEFGTTEATVRVWIDAGAVRVSPSGLVWLPDIEATIQELKDRPCDYPDCDVAVGDINILRRFCAEHSAEVKRYSYPAMDADQRAQHYQAVQRWRARNPERRRVIANRAVRAYRERQRAKRGVA
jgi:Homeodomain-like domain